MGLRRKRGRWKLLYTRELSIGGNFFILRRHANVRLVNAQRLRPWRPPMLPALHRTLVKDGFDFEDTGWGGGGGGGRRNTSMTRSAQCF